MRRMLIAEDDPALRQVLRRTFDKDYEVHEAGNGVDGLEQALELQPDVVISDQRMPRMSGVEMLSHLREQLPDSVRILVTGFDDYSSVVDAVNAAHIHHYFEKPFHPHHMRTVVDALVRSAELEAQRDAALGQLQESVTKLERVNEELQAKEALLSETVRERTRELQDRNDELVEANRQLRDLAVRDGLTGLFNHRYLVEHIEMEVARSQRYGRQFCLLFLDIDDFKRINDSYGHQAGDLVLCRIADLFRPKTPEGLRSSDFCARYGGEEFCLLLPETPPEGGRIKAERLRQALVDCDWSEVHAEFELPVTASIGVAHYPANGQTMDELLKQADAACYEAKQQGKNRVVASRSRSDEPPSAP